MLLGLAACLPDEAELDAERAAALDIDKEVDEAADATELAELLPSDVQGPVCGGFSPPPVDLKWEAVVDSRTVTMKMSSHTLAPVAVELELEVMAAGKHRMVQLPGAAKRLPVAESMPLAFNLQAYVPTFLPEEFTVSGSFLVHANVSYEDGSRERVTSPPRYFHPLASGGYAVYDDTDLVQKYGRGDYRGLHRRAADGVQLGIIDGGQGLSPELAAQALAQDPAGSFGKEG